MNSSFQTPVPSRKASRSRVGRWVRAGIACAASVVTVGALATGCLDRPLAPAAPHTSNIFVDQIKQTAIDKIDLLFMIDNSISMADKQAILAKAVPGLLQRLINPVCVSTSNPALSQPGPGPTAPCPDGYKKEFSPINDIHIGVISSSLGSHGGQYCDEKVEVQIPMPPHLNPMLNDRAYLLGKVRPGLYSFNNTGFLAWEPSDTTLSAHERDSATMSNDFTSMVTSAGETGCGYEAQLEAWYRFLVEPFPPQSVTLNTMTNQAELSTCTETDKSGCDNELLAQRASFLRVDSLVAIVMLSDENDCSIVDGGYGWLSSTYRLGSRAFTMPRATSACTTKGPNDPCCQSCIETAAHAGCSPIASDSECAKGPYSSDEDPLNLRCWQQKRRFGLDLLYPTDRYVTGLLANQGLQVNGKTVPNPLYSDLNNSGAIARDPSLVFLAGIVGVPWQDIATPESRMGPGLKYLHASELGAVWPQILGDPANGVNPSDPLMIETPTPRSGTSLYGGPMAPENSPTVGSPQANSINGHEYHAVADLQYACIFPLEARRDCTLVAEDKGCDCKQSELSDVNRVAYNKPLCQPPGTANTGTTQYFAKAYPGLRQLQVLKDYGPNSIVASICPKHMGGDIEDPSYGYYPALDAFYDRLKDTTHSRCFPRPLSVDPATGLVNCAAVEATSESAGCDCAARPGRTSEPLSESSSDPRTQKLVGAFRDGLKNNLGVCDKPGKPDCSSFCLCEIQQLGKDAQGLCSVASASSVCQPSSQETPAAGFCYVDGTSPAVRDCAESEKQKILFVGPGTPWKGATTFMACAIQKSAGM